MIVEDQYIDSVFGKLPQHVVERWSSVVKGMEPILELYTDATVNEIQINGFNKIFVKRGKKIELTDCRFSDEDDLYWLISQLAKVNNTVVGDKSPILDAKFPDMSRANCTLLPVTPLGITMTIRVASKKRLTSEDLLVSNTLTEQMLRYLEKSINVGSKMLVSGSVGSGKTSLLRVLSSFVPREDHRLVTVEDTMELFIDLPNCISIETPYNNLSGVTYEQCMRNTLRMGGDRTWCGELRSHESAKVFFDMMNVGNEGGTASTLHANNVTDAYERLSLLCSDNNSQLLTYYKKELLKYLDVLVHAKHGSFGHKIQEIAEIQGGKIVMLFSFDESTGLFITNDEGLRRSKYFHLL